LNQELQRFRGNPEDNIEQWLYSVTRRLDLTKYSDRGRVSCAADALEGIAKEDYFLHEHMVLKTLGLGITWEQFVA